MNDKAKILQLSYGNYVSADDYFKLQSNWNSLREWIKNEIKQEHHTKHWNMLDKMNELERKDKE